MKLVTMLFRAPIEPLQSMIDDGLRVGHKFEYDGQILIGVVALSETNS